MLERCERCRKNFGLVGRVHQCEPVSWLRVSLAVWRCVELEPVLTTAGADYARHWRGVHREPLCSQSPCSAPTPRAVLALNAYFSTHCRRYPQG